MTNTTSSGLNQVMILNFVSPRISSIILFCPQISISKCFYAHFHEYHVYQYLKFLIWQMYLFIFLLTKLQIITPSTEDNVHLKHFYVLFSTPSREANLKEIYR